MTTGSGEGVGRSSGADGPTTAFQAYVTERPHATNFRDPLEDAGGPFEATHEGNDESKLGGPPCPYGIVP